MLTHRHDNQNFLVYGLILSILIHALGLLALYLFSPSLPLRQHSVIILPYQSPEHQATTPFIRSSRLGTHQDSRRRLGRPRTPIMLNSQLGTQPAARLSPSTKSIAPHAPRGIIPFIVGPSQAASYADTLFALLEKYPSLKHTILHHLMLRGRTQSDSPALFSNASFLQYASRVTAMSSLEIRARRNIDLYGQVTDPLRSPFPGLEIPLLPLLHEFQELLR